MLKFYPLPPCFECQESLIVLPRNKDFLALHIFGRSGGTAGSLVQFLLAIHGRGEVGAEQGEGGEDINEKQERHERADRTIQKLIAPKPAAQIDREQRGGKFP